MDYKIKYLRSADKNLSKLPVPIANRIVSKMREYMSLENPLSKAKRLKGDLSDFYRFRIGDYRVVFRIEEDGCLVVLAVVWIGHRKDVYK